MPPSGRGARSRSAASGSGSCGREVLVDHREDGAHVRFQYGLASLGPVAVLGQVDVLDAPRADVLADPEQQGKLGERDIGEPLAAQRGGEVVDVAQTQLGELLAQGDQHLLLAHVATDVGGDVVVPGADVFQRLHAVHVLRPGEDRHPVGGVRVGAAGDVVGVVVVHHRVAGHDVDAAHLINEIDQPLQPDPDVVVDLDLEVLLDGGDLGIDPSGAATGVAERLGDLAAGQLFPTRRVEGDPEVAGDGEHGDAARGGIDPDQDHRLGAAETGGAPGGRELAVVVGTDRKSVV